MTDQAQEIQLSIDEAQQIIDLGSALQRLEKNADFVKIVKEDYLHNEAIRMVTLKSHPAMQGPDQQKLVMAGIDGIGAFVQYLNKVHQQASVAAEAVRSGQEVLEEMAEEGEI